MSNEWSGDGGFSKGGTQDFSSHNQGANVDWEQHRRNYDQYGTGTPDHEWSPGEPPTQDFNDWGSSHTHTMPQHRAEGGDNCGMSWLKNPWPILKDLVGWGLIIVVLFCLAAFVVGCIVGAVQGIS